MIHYLTRRFSFSASHRLADPARDPSANRERYGACANVHGHNYRLEVTVRGQVDPAIGFFADVLELKAVVEREVVALCDHHHLNEVPAFADLVPTMENLAQRIWGLIMRPLAERGMDLYEVLLAESDDSLVRLRRD